MHQTSLLVDVEFVICGLSIFDLQATTAIYSNQQHQWPSTNCQHSPTDCWAFTRDIWLHKDILLGWLPSAVAISIYNKHQQDDRIQIEGINEWISVFCWPWQFSSCPAQFIQSSENQKQLIPELTSFSSLKQAPNSNILTWIVHYIRFFVLWSNNTISFNREILFLNLYFKISGIFFFTCF